MELPFQRLFHFRLNFASVERDHFVMATTVPDTLKPALVEITNDVFRKKAMLKCVIDSETEEQLAQTEELLLKLIDFSGTDRKDPNSDASIQINQERERSEFH